MIIARAPYRVSFLGGSTDYPLWYRENGGAVLSTTIDKYAWITLRYLPPFFEHKHRIVYSQEERAQHVGEIRHPAVRECLRFTGVEEGIELHHDGDVPARSGLGTSSSFTVGLLHALHALKGEMPTKLQLANEAIHVERDLIGENVGSQDQTAAAFGGLNRIDFGPGDEIKVQPIVLKRERLEELQSHLMLLYSGFSRTASQVVEEQLTQTPNKGVELRRMHQMVDEGIAILTGGGDISDFGKLLQEGWELKRSLSSKVGPIYVNAVIDTALAVGALGAKVCGAGGGGFILLFADPALHERIVRKLGLLHVPFRFESEGSRVVYHG